MSDAPPTADGPAGPAAGPGPATAGVLVAVLVAVLAGTWAASVGPSDVLRPEPDPATAERSPATQQETAEPEPSGEVAPEPERREPPGWLLALSRATQVAVVALLAYFALRWLLRERVSFRRRRARPAPGPPPPELESPDDPDLISESLVAGADEQRAGLRAGEPRNAIVACWHRFEVQATVAGAARRPWETSAEFGRRVLGLVAADDQAVAALADLYREARFSEHPLGEADRQRAEAALWEIHRSLRVRAGAR